MGAAIADEALSVVLAGVASDRSETGKAGGAAMLHVAESSRPGSLKRCLRNLEASLRQSTFWRFPAALDYRDR